MEKEQISLLQLFYVMVGFEIGNTMIYGLGAGAKQDSWLVILTAMFGGFVLIFVYVKLTQYFPGKSLIQMIPEIVGRFISYPFILLYIIYFLYLSSRAYRDFGELIASTILTETPMIIVISCFMFSTTYCLRGGIESFGKMGEVVFPIYFFSIVVIWVLLLSVENFNIYNLTPILGNGISPIIKELFPAVLTFPFGELIIMTMFFPFLNNQRKIKKTGIVIVLFSGILLTINIFMILSVLGPELYSKVSYPLLTATRMVSIADFLERFDALIILMLVSGVFFKVGCWTFGAAAGITYLFKLKQYDSVVLGLGTIIIPLALITASGQVQFVEFGLEYFTLYAHVPFQIIFPIVLLCIAFIRKKISR